MAWVRQPAPSAFNDLKDLAAPDGTPWIDPATGGMPVWCPGQSIPLHTFVLADHNGVYRWESQLAAPGQETEGAFRNFTPWRSVN